MTNLARHAIMISTKAETAQRGNMNTHGMPSHIHRPRLRKWTRAERMRMMASRSNAERKPVSLAKAPWEKKKDRAERGAHDVEL